MKKILLTAAILAVSSTSFAEIATLISEKNHAYVSANGGVAKFQRSHKGQKHKNVAIATVAVGYNFMDNLRADVSLDHYFSPKATEKNTLTTTKFHANSLLLNVYTDVLASEMGRVFVGVGAGAAKVKGKINTAGVNVPLLKKSKNEFSYALYAGLATEVSQGIVGEVKYAYKNLGKNNLFSNKLKSHNVTLGLRFDI